MSPRNHEPNPNTNEDTPVLSWTVHVARQEPGRLAVVVPLVLMACVCAGFVGGPFGSLVVALVMIATLSDYLFPVHYVVTRKRATCKRLLGMSEISWQDVKHCYLDEFGVKLSPLIRKTRLEAYRGVFLRFGDNKDQVIETVKSLRVNAC